MPATAFLLAAGLGTRLRPLTDQLPKALVPVCGVAMLDHALALVRAHGHRRVLVNAHHLWQPVAAWAQTHDVALQVELPDILGTGGGLRAAIDRLAETVVVVNADILCDVDLSALADAVPLNGAAMALRPSTRAAQIGPVEPDDHGRIVRISSVVGQPGSGQAGFHFTGVHALSRAAIQRVPADGLQCVVRTAYRQLVPLGLVGSIQHHGAWIDIGTPTAYLDANLAVLRGQVRAPVDPWSRGRHVATDSWAGPDARVDGIIFQSVIGAGAVVSTDTELSRCVVWDGVAVPPGHYERTIFASDGVVVRA
ncbi:MAG: NTP transferase domain-containing protein [Oligoflexia bacterium]|nr:NTP transferase domain-containing protein [Oligoflexia bacterium]